MLWTGCFGMRNHEGTQLLSRSRLVDHTCIPLISQVSAIGDLTTSI
jgi:hypothetical protein